MDKIYSFKVDQVTNKTYMNYEHFLKSKKNIVKFKNKLNKKKISFMQNLKVK